MKTYHAYQNKATNTTIHPQPDGTFGVCYYYPTGSEMFMNQATAAAMGCLIGESCLDDLVEVFGPFAKVAYTATDDF